MKQNNRDKAEMLKEKLITARNAAMDHPKLVMPIVLVVCVLITILVALNANQRDALEKKAELAAAAAAAAESTATVDGISSPQFELEENAHQDINQVVKSYYDAQAAGDIETISSLNAYLNDIEKIRVEELGKYIESYPVLNVYTKPGLTEKTYVAYVYSEVKFEDVEKALPGMQTYYIGQDENGNFFINDGTYDETIWNYIKEMTLQDDVVDLNNKVVVSYNELLAKDEELSEFIAYLKEKINEEVGEILAKTEQPKESADVEEAEEASEEATEEATEEVSDGEVKEADVIKTVKATEVVNIRTSDSETADKLDKAQIGQEFILLEEKGNGWSRIKYKDRDAYIKSEYLEVVSEETVQEEAPFEEQENTASESNSSDTVSGSVTVKESVKVRKSAGTNGEVLGTVYAGDELELVMKQADGWTKVKYKGKTAYVKSDYVE